MKLTKIAAATATRRGAGPAAPAAEARDDRVRGNYPSEDMEWTIAFGPGGGNDIMARTIVDILQKDELYPENIVVENREGGSGATGWGYLLGQSGTGLRHLDDVRARSSPRRCRPTPAGPTRTSPPSGLLAADDALLLDLGRERASRPARTGSSTPRRRARSSSAASAPSTSTTSSTQMIADAGGLRDRVRALQRGGPGADLAALRRARRDGVQPGLDPRPGRGRRDEPAAVHRPRAALEALPDVPTGEEKGITDLPSMPRGLILPPDAPEEAQEWWIDTMKEVVETDGVAGVPRRELPRRGRALGRRLHVVPRRDAVRASRTSSTSSARCDHDAPHRHEPQRAGRPPAPRLGAAQDRLPGRCSWRSLAVYTEMAFGMEWRTAAGRIGPGFFPRIVGGLGLALTLRRAGRSAARARPSRGRGRRRWRTRPATPTSASTRRRWSLFLVAAGLPRRRRCSRSARSSPRRCSCCADAQPAQPGPPRAQRGAQRRRCRSALYLLFAVAAQRRAARAASCPGF